MTDNITLAQDWLKELQLRAGGPTQASIARNTGLANHTVGRAFRFGLERERGVRPSTYKIIAEHLGGDLQRIIEISHHPRPDIEAVMKELREHRQMLEQILEQVTTTKEASP